MRKYLYRATFMGGAMGWDYAVDEASESTANAEASHELRKHMRSHGLNEDHLVAFDLVGVRP